MAKRTPKTSGASHTADRRSFDEMTKEQIAIYAKELNEQFRKERDLRVALQQRDSMLDQRAREVSALNHLLQEQLLEWHRFAEDYRDVLLSLRQMIDDGALGSAGADALSELVDGAMPPEDDADADPLAS